MPPGGKRPGAGRPKGSPNKATVEMKNCLQKLFDKKFNDLDEMIDETRNGIEIEKTMTVDGKSVTVLGRLNADPGKAADLMLKLAEFCHPKLGRMEHTGAAGGPIEFTVRDLGKES
jgi:hypothetical protein